MSDIFSALDTVFTELTRVATQAGEVRSTINHAIVFMQRQDILRQGIDHIRLLLEEVEVEFISGAGAYSTNRPEGRERLCAYVGLSRQIGEIGAGLLARSQNELTSLLTELSSALQTLLDSTQLLDRTKATLDGDLETRLRAPSDALERIGAVLQIRMNLTVKCGSVITGLKEPLSTLESLLASLGSVDLGLRNLVMMMRLEMPRLEGMHDAAGLIQGVNSCHREFVDCLDLTRQPLEQFRGSVTEMHRALDTINKQHVSITELVTKLHTHAEKITEAGGTFFTDFQGIVSIGNAVRGTAARCKQTLDTFSGTLVALRDAQEACLSLSRNAGETQAALEQAGLFADVREETLGKLRQMLARFTVFADKAVAAEATGLTVQAGDESGTLTLF